MKDNPIISAPAGVFKGSVLTSFSGLPFAAFRGIPFALPPVGPLRFAKPKPHPKLEGVYDATNEASISIQPVGVELGPQQQEDCLYLSVFTPSPANDADNDLVGKTALKKVLVYIHGGAFFMGCGNEYVPGDFVTQGDVIVVTFNYRLSWLGFVKGPIEEVGGNMGLWDQLEALKWVKANIGSFGGDPNDITLAGQSMGGESVSAFSVVEQAKDLFTKGILMSGTMFTSKSTPGSSDVLLDMLVDKVGLDRNGKTYTQLLEELQNLPEDRFILPLQNEITNKFTTIDGKFFPKSFSEMKQDVDYLSRVGFFDRDYLVTITSNEGLVVSTGPTSSFDTAKGEVSLAKRLWQSDWLHQKLCDWYGQPGHHECAPLNDLFTDPIIMMPSFEFLHTAAGSKRKRNSYFLWFDHNPLFAPSGKPEAGGIPHSVDLCYLFDISASHMYRTYYNLEVKEFTEEDRKLKKMYIDLIVDFMHNGNANQSLAPHVKETWQPFEPKDECYLDFGPKPTVKHFPLTERRKLWTSIVPEWKKQENSQ